MAREDIKHRTVDYIQMRLTKIKNNLPNIKDPAELINMRYELLLLSQKWEIESDYAKRMQEIIKIQAEEERKLIASQNFAL